jgi:hypothetical protein
MVKGCISTMGHVRRNNMTATDREIWERKIEETRGPRWGRHAAAAGWHINNGTDQPTSTMEQSPS